MMGISSEIIGLFGFLIVTGLSINAFFLKSLVESLNQVKVQTATLLEKSTNSEDEIKILRERMHKLANDVHSKMMDIEIKLTKLEKTRG